MRKKIEITLMCLFVAFLIFYYWKQHQDRQDIEANRGETVGVIVDYYVIFPESHYLIYEYSVMDRKYRKKVPAEKIFKHCIEDKKCIGQKFLVTYEIGKPENSSIVLDEPR